MTQPIETLLAEIGALSELSPAALQAFAQRMVPRRLHRGETLMEAGEPADTLYIVLGGRFHVLVDDGARVIAEIGPSEPVGEIAFFAGGTRTARVVAARDSEVAGLTRRDYDALAEEVPAIPRAILRVLAERLGHATPAAPAMEPKPPVTMVLCPAGGEPIPPAIVDQLTAALAAHGPLVVMRREDLPPSLDAEAESAIAGHLQALERQGARILLVAAGTDTAWDRTALRQSDGLVLVGRLGAAEGGPVSHSPLERYALDLFRPADSTLVLWRESAAAPITGSEAWLAERPVHFHHHVALDRPQDLQRVGRFLTGRALGLVMSGGGALGCAHLGVVRALKEAGAELDILGGTSVGAAMAVALASGVSPQEMMAIADQIFVESGAMRRLTVPVFSILDHHRLDAELQRHFGDLTFENLPTNAFAVSTSLSQNRSFLHRRGPLWRAVRASASIPAALPPFVTEAGEVLVDGAILDNQPIDVMRELKPGPNIVVTFSAARDWRVDADYATLPRRARLVRDIVMRRRVGGFPKIMEVLLRSMMIASYRGLHEMKIGDDIRIVPPILDGMNILDWQRGREQEEAAYRHTAALIEAAGGIEAMLASPAATHRDMAPAEAAL
ncbi:patatin-like phospholipase family protein [Acuticoccus kandeliae]|uniref:patatin-like phospholipase family protein n=1 Tax=Acuticoccus kandeliae TaxID=2073160 RepID=UPI0013003676|nr:patatin-like phospholipase family protein [Acuticoccus kandeliae]